MKTLINFVRRKGFPRGSAAVLGFIALCLGGGNLMAQAPPNDDLVNADVLTGTNDTATGTTVEATAQPGEPSHAGYPATHSIWYVWTAPENGSVLINLARSEPGTVVAVYTGKDLDSLTSVASNANANADGTGRCVFQAVNGAFYDIAVDVISTQGPVHLSLQFTTTYFPPAITQQPQSQSVIEGATAEFSVVAQSDSPLTYQWTFDGTNLVGATNSELSLTNVALTQAGTYQVTVSNQGGSTNSQPATLTVFARPPNDDFADSINLPGTNATVFGTNVYATSEPLEPLHDGWPSGQSVWWNWTAPATGIVSVSVNNFSGDQVLDVYTGSALSQLSLVGDSQYFSSPVAVQFIASPGTTYQIAVTGVYQGGGSFQLSLTFAPTNFPPVITNQPANQAVLLGGTAAFQVGVSSALPVAYQWFFNSSTPLAGATNASLVLSNVLSSQAGNYQVAVSNASGFALSGQATLVVNVPPVNDDFSNSIMISGLSFSKTGDNQFATSEPGEPAHAGYGPGASVWWNWTASGIGDASVSVTGFSGQETLAVYTGTNVSQLTGVASNNWNNGPLSVHFPATNGTTYQIAVSDPSGAGGSFQLQVQLALSNFPPGIVTQPPAVTNVTAGSVVQFLYYVTNDFYVTNLWYYQANTNATPVLIGGGDGGGGGFGGGGGGGAGGGGGGGGGGGAGGGGGDGGGDGGGGGDSSLWLNFGDVSTNQDGYYYTVVTSYGGSVTSAPTLLVVHSPPSNDNFTNRIPLTGTNLTPTGTTAYATLETNEPSYPGLTSGGSVWWTWTATDSGTASITVTNNMGAFQILQIFTGNSLATLVSVTRSVGAQNVLSTSFITTPGTAYQIAVVGGQSPIEINLQFTDADTPPQIIQQPADVTVAAGGVASFQVGAQGGGVLSYQWFFDATTLLTGATNPTLTLLGVATTNQGSYSVTVGNQGGSVNSAQATLTINLRPINDDFTNRIVLPGTNATTTDSDQYATFESGEPPPYPAQGWSSGDSVWWTWTATNDGRLTLTVTNAPGEIQILDVYTGSDLEGLSLVTNNISFSGLLTNQCLVTAGTAYQISVATPTLASEGGPFELELNFVSLVFPPVITVQPLSVVTVTNGDSAAFQVMATGAPPLTYQWQFSGTNLPGATNSTLQLMNVTTNQAGNYNAFVSNPGGGTNSQVAILRVLQSPPNDDFTNRIVLTGKETNTIGSNDYATSESGEPAHAGFGPFGSVWWSYTPPALGIIDVDLTNSFYGAVVAIYTGTNVAQLTLVASNAFGNTDGTANVTFLGQPGVAYQIAVQGSSAASAGPIHLSVIGIFPPTILSQPGNQAVALGETAAFGVTAQAGGPLNYQWSFNGAEIIGATNQILAIQNVGSNNLGSYSVLVSDEVGSVASTVATLSLTSVLVGQITDATTGQPLSGVLVSVGSITNITDTNGDYRLAGVQSSVLNPDFDSNVRSGAAPLTVQFYDESTVGAVVLIASTNGYYTYTNATVSVTNGLIATNGFSISPILPAGSVRLVLNWGANPRDLDAHLLTPEIDGESYHIYYQTGSRGSLTNAPFAELDHDATNGFGPETITIAQFFPGTYQYYVHKYAGIGPLAGSGATVKVYTTAGLIQTFTAPATGVGDYWQVINIDGTSQQFTLIDLIGTNDPSVTPLAPAREPRKVPGPNSPTPQLAGYSWIFGDGSTSTVENPSHTYTNAGLYTVSFTVTDTNNVSERVTKTNYIQVTGPALVPPVITRQPGSVTTNQGATVYLEVNATGTPPLSYQWQFDGQNLPGAIDPILAFYNIFTNQAGTYSVIVTNAAGTAISSNGYVTILVPPSITQQPLNIVISQGSSATFTVGANGSIPLSYQWQFGGAPISGATGPSLPLSSTALANIGHYSVVVSNAAGSATSKTASLTFFDVKRYPGITISSPVAGKYNLQVLQGIGSTNWMTFTNVTSSPLPSTYIDFNPATNQIEFYRAVFTP